MEELKEIKKKMRMRMEKNESKKKMIMKMD